MRAEYAVDMNARSRLANAALLGGNAGGIRSLWVACMDSLPVATPGVDLDVPAEMYGGGYPGGPYGGMGGIYGNPYAMGGANGLSARNVLVCLLGLVCICQATAWGGMGMPGAYPGCRCRELVAKVPLVDTPGGYAMGGMGRHRSRCSRHGNGLPWNAGLRRNVWRNGNRWYGCYGHASHGNGRNVRRKWPLECQLWVTPVMYGAGALGGGGMQMQIMQQQMAYQQQQMQPLPTANAKSRPIDNKQLCL